MPLPTVSHYAPHRNVGRVVAGPCGSHPLNQPTNQPTNQTKPTHARRPCSLTTWLSLPHSHTPTLPHSHTPTLPHTLTLSRETDPQHNQYRVRHHQRVRDCTRRRRWDRKWRRAAAATARIWWRPWTTSACCGCSNTRVLTTTLAAASLRRTPLERAMRGSPLPTSA